MMGGRCDGGALVSDTFENHMHDKCRDCMSRVYVEEEGLIRCQVLDGTEKTVLCPELHQFIRYNEIRLYGVNQDPEIENPKRRR